MSLNFQPNQPGKIILYYFDIYGKGEPIRMLLNYAKVPFEDLRLTEGDFKQLRDLGKFEFKQVPVLELQNGKCYSQSQSILRMIGKAFGLYPIADKLNEDVQKEMNAVEAERFKALSEEDRQIDRINAIREGQEIDSILEANFKQRFEWLNLEMETDQNRVQTLMPDYFQDTVTPYFEALENKLKAQGDYSCYLVNNKMSIADFDTASYGLGLFMNPNNKFYELHQKEIQKYPRLIKYYQDFREQFKDYFNNRNNKLPY
eukprot:403375787